MPPIRPSLKSMDTTTTAAAAEHRYIHGLRVFTRAFRALMLRNGLSNQNLEDLANWAYPEQRSWLGSGQISMLRNGQYLRPGPKIFDSLGQLNIALARLAGCEHGEAGEEGQRVGPPPLAPWAPEAPYWLAHPLTGCPLTAGDLFMVWIGRLDLDRVPLEPTAELAESFSPWLARHCQQWCADRGILFSDGLPRILEAYPSRDEPRIERLKLVLAGFGTFSVDELTAELVDLTAMVRKLNDDVIPPAVHPLLNGSE